jgi:hypothetical protein
MIDILTVDTVCGRMIVGRNDTGSDFIWPVIYICISQITATVVDDTSSVCSS